MRLPHDHPTSRDIAHSVHQLFRAENRAYQGNSDDTLAAGTERKVVESILAADFIQITRGKGQVLTRAGLVEDISENARPEFRRHVSRAQTEVDLFSESGVAVATTLLPATNHGNTAIEQASYRNLHVFVNRDGVWKCVVWQVTKVATE